MVAGKDLTKQIVGKRIRLEGHSIVEGRVKAVGFQTYGISLEIDGVVDNFGIPVTILDDTEVQVLDEQS